MAISGGWQGISCRCHCVFQWGSPNLKLRDATMRLMSCRWRLCSAPVWKARVRRWIKRSMLFIKELFQRQVKWKETIPSIGGFGSQESKRTKVKTGKIQEWKGKREPTYNRYDSEGLIASHGCKRSSHRWGQSYCKWSIRGLALGRNTGTVASAWGYSGGNTLLQKTHRTSIMQISHSTSDLRANTALAPVQSSHCAWECFIPQSAFLFFVCRRQRG